MAVSLAPEAGLLQTVHWALAHACAAPSELNSQPWRFAVQGVDGDRTAEVELRLDPARQLPAIDPVDREAHLACGAALLNLRLALHGAGLGADVSVCPDPLQPDLLARVVISGTAAETPEEAALRTAIPVRATHRSAFDPVGVPDDVVAGLLAQVANEGAHAMVLETAQRLAFEVLSGSAQERLWNDGAFRREVAQWTASNRGRRRDGVPGSAYGLAGWRSEVEPLLVRLGYPPKGPQDLDPAAAVDAPLLVVVGSADDQPAAWLRAGAGMQRLLLAACALGISGSFLNAALHTDDGRQDLARLVGLDYPQVVLRLGYAVPALVTPRRSASGFQSSLAP